MRLYGLPGCGPCEVAKLFLRHKGVAFEFVDLRKAPEVLQRLGGLSSGIVLEIDGAQEVLVGVSLPRLERWYADHQGELQPA